MAAKTIKTTVVMVATAGSTRVFRSKSEVPDVLRQEMRRTIRRGNSATILIADRQGRRELLRSMRGKTSAVKVKAVVDARRRRLRNRLWAEVLSLDWLDLGLVGLAGLLLWIAAIG